jgi:hypothetical protein
VEGPVKAAAFRGLREIEKVAPVSVEAQFKSWM